MNGESLDASTTIEVYPPRPRRTVIPFGDLLAGRIRDLVATRDAANAAIKAMLEGALAIEDIDLDHENWIAKMDTASFVFLDKPWTETAVPHSAEASEQVDKRDAECDALRVTRT